MQALKAIKKSERGSALLTALLVMTLAASAAMAMIVRQNFDIRRTEQMLTTDRIYQHTLGVETWAVLELLAARANLEEGVEPIDTLYDDWAQPLETTAVEEGYLGGEIIDLQGLFNLNNLVEIESWQQAGFGEEDITEPVDEEEQPVDEGAEAGEPLFVDDDALEALDRFSQLAIFTRLLMLVEPNLYEEDAFEIAVAVRNWLDPESGIDYIYENAFPPYLPGHRPMASVTELRMVAGMTPELFDALINYVTVLPPSLLAELGFEQGLEGEEGEQISSAVTPINVNTAPPLVLQALLGGISEEEAQDISLAPGEAGFQSREEFLEAINIEDEHKRLIEIGLADKIGVNSNHFLVRSEAGLDRQSLVLFSLLQRVDDGYVRVVWRSRGTL